MVKELRTYEVATRNEVYRVKVPSAWRITYGDTVPGVPERFAGGNREFTVRFYESDTKQRLIFRDVVTFRDMSVPVQKLNVEYNPGQDGLAWTADGEEEWVNLPFVDLEELEEE